MGRLCVLVGWWNEASKSSLKIGREQSRYTRDVPLIAKNAMNGAPSSCGGPCCDGDRDGIGGETA